MGTLCGFVCCGGGGVTDDFLRQLHEQEEVLSMWGPDIPPAGLTGESALRQLLGAFAGFAALGLFIKCYGIPERPAVPREFPYDGLVKELGGVEEIKVGLR
jgi:NADH dehydrogenase (ubiquinone) 1 beta subcomplex subunit 8